MMGVVLRDPVPGDVSSEGCVVDERMEKMLGKDLTLSDKEEYKIMFRKQSFKFISNL